MITKRTLAAAVSLTAAALLITACTPAATPTPTLSSGTPTPTTAARQPVDPPADEAAAVAESEATIELLLDAQEKVSSEGGTDVAPYEALAIGRALENYKADAIHIAKGPILNADGKNVKGQSKAEGRISFTPTTAYGQKYNDIENGLVIVPGCLDASQRKITTADGSPAMQNPNLRNKVEFQVTYVKDQKLWMVSDFIETGGTC